MGHAASVSVDSGGSLQCGPSIDSAENTVCPCDKKRFLIQGLRGSLDVANVIIISRLNNERFASSII